MPEEDQDYPFCPESPEDNKSLNSALASMRECKKYGMSRSDAEGLLMSVVDAHRETSDLKVIEDSTFHVQTLLDLVWGPEALETHLKA